MNNQEIKQSLLSKFLGSYFAIYFSAFFIGSYLGSIILSATTKRILDYEDLFYSLIFALATSSLATLFYWLNFKELFLLLSKDEIETHYSEDYVTKTFISCKSFQLDSILSRLEKSGLLITYIDINKNIIKIRKRIKIFNLGCGGILQFDDDKKELTVISFSLEFGSNKRLIRFLN